MDKIGFTTSVMPPPILMAVDNQGAIAMTKMGAPSRRTKYINIRYHHFRECIEQGIVDPYYVPGWFFTKR
jgi:hypothetical protein